MKSGSMLILRRRMFFHYSASLHMSVFIHNGTFIYLHAVDGERGFAAEATRNLKPKSSIIFGTELLFNLQSAWWVPLPLCDTTVL